MKKGNYMTQLDTFRTFAVAALSWHLYESPINNLKKNSPT
jgi:peptidoglycan/LPS O-acetylase OafA/YrhL